MCFVADQPELTDSACMEILLIVDRFVKNNSSYTILAKRYPTMFKGISSTLRSHQEVVHKSHTTKTGGLLDLQDLTGEPGKRYIIA